MLSTMTSCCKQPNSAHSRCPSAAEPTVSSRSSSKFIRSIWSLLRLAISTASGWATAWMPWARFEQRISDADDDSLNLAWLVISQDVPDATNGAKQFYFSRDVNLVAEILHVHVNDVGGRIERNVPYIAHEGFTGYGFAGVVHQALENGKLS